MDINSNEDSLLILYGSSFIDYESDNDDDEYRYDIEERAIFDSRCTDILNSIGSEKFKVVYQVLMSEIRQYPIEWQMIFCRNIISKIYEVYDFSFHKEIDFSDINNIFFLYDLISFISFDNITLISNVWSIIDVNIENINIREFVNSREDGISKEIGCQSEILSLNILITDFLISYYKIAEWFITQSELNRTEIIIRTSFKLKEENHG